jgi:hypothetical protein
MRPVTRARRARGLMPLSPPRALRRRGMLEIFGEPLPAKMTVGELRRTLFTREDLTVPPSTVALVRGHWGHRCWMATHDPALTDVLMDRLSRRFGGYRHAA